MSVTHAKVSAKADGADTSLVLPSDWNAAHTIADGTITASMLDASIQGITSGTADPSAGAGIAATPGALYLRNNAGSGEVWLKTAAGDTAWTQVLITG